MLFGRGHWAVFGIKKQDAQAFLQDNKAFVAALQAQALATTKKKAVPTAGINPFGTPRLDEVDGDVTPDEFRLGDSQYGFWVVFNDYEDVTDPASKKEQIAYTGIKRPFKFLNKDEKKVVEASVKASAVMSRLQFPVLLDFETGRAFVADANKDRVGTVRHVVESLGVPTHSLAWQFGGFDWPARLLNKIDQDTKFYDQMSERAEELKRFTPDQIHKLDDKAMEKVVSTFFALTELETGLWAGLSTPARIRVFGSDSEPVATSCPSTAFSLLSVVPGKSRVAAANVVFQTLESKFNKKGEEKQVRTDIFTLEINDNMNLMDAGAALLRGFDLPGFKKEIKALIKEKGQISIQQYWHGWLEGLNMALRQFTDNTITTLQASKTRSGMLPFEGETTVVEVGE